MIIMTLLGIYFVNVNMRRQVVQTRKSWQLLFLYLIVASLIPFLNAETSFLLLDISCSAAFAGNCGSFFYPQKRAVPLLLHWAMFGLYIAIAFFFK